MEEVANPLAVLYAIFALVGSVWILASVLGWIFVKLTGFDPKRTETGDSEVKGGVLFGEPVPILKKPKQKIQQFQERRGLKWWHMVIGTVASLLYIAVVVMGWLRLLIAQ